MWPAGDRAWRGRHRLYRTRHSQPGSIPYLRKIELMRGDDGGLDTLKCRSDCPAGVVDVSRFAFCCLVLVGCSSSRPMGSDGMSGDAGPRDDRDGGSDAGHAPDSGAEADAESDGDARSEGSDSGSESCESGPDCGQGLAEEVCDGVDNDGDVFVDENSYLCFQEQAADSIDELITRCPSAGALAAIHADLDVSFEFGALPYPNEIVCTAEQSGRALTHLEERVYQALIAMRALHFDRALPWTELGLYEWLVDSVEGIRVRDDVGVNHCCTPPEGKSGQYVNLTVTSEPTVLASDLWASANGGLVGLVSLLVHEARHTLLPHSCGAGDDQTISELGALGAQYYLYSFLAFHSDPCFLRPTLPASPRYPGQLFTDTAYLEMMRDNATYMHGHSFCSEPSVALSPPTPIRGCMQACSPATERCNRVDDDCDGVTDEDVVGATCGFDEGECTVGTVTGCDVGLERCSGQRPVQEVCGDGLDNDCDGEADGARCEACAGTTGEIFNGSIVVRTSADLAMLSGITCVTDTLHIISNFADLSAFSQLEAVGGDMWIYANTQLQDLTGLQNLKRVGRLFVRDNIELRTLLGIESLQSIDTYHLMIDGNPKLENLDGLSGLTTIASQLSISSNATLQDISGLSALTGVGGGVFIHDNPMLPECGVDAFLSDHGFTCADCSNNYAAGVCP
jgi:hypothetical protein